jgi:ribonuclease-3
MTAAADLDAAAIALLEDRLGYGFRSAALLEEALCHSSMPRVTPVAATSNERLEFLGDRVLGLVVAELLFRMYPQETVGHLARRHTALVRREALEQVARAIGLPALVRMSKGEEDSGGRDNPGLLSDACEALIAAIYLDGGLEPASAFVRRHWLAMIEGYATPPKDAKTALQEWMQARGLTPPIYREIERAGPAHAPTFLVEVALPNRPPVRAFGASKRAAEQAAAELALATLSVEPGR